MAGFFRRLFKVAESEAHSVVDKFENPIKLTEQGIRDLKKDLQSSMKSYAEVKALQIRTQRELEEKKELAGSYERKAMMLLKKADGGSLERDEADRLAGEALGKKEQAATTALTMAKQLESNEATVAQLSGGMKKLKSQISSWENELTTLKARAKVATATKKVNQQLAQIDSNGTIAMLEKMKTKVAEDEALAQSYGEMAMVETSIDAEIDTALSSGSGEIKAADSVAALKAKMGIS